MNNATVTDLGYSPSSDAFDLSEVPPSKSDSFDQAEHERKPSYRERLQLTRATLAESERQELLERAGGPFSSGSEEEEEAESDDSGEIDLEILFCVLKSRHPQYNVRLLR